jgi:ABC-type sugar transport system substrate-binding protein
MNLLRTARIRPVLLACLAALLAVVVAACGSSGSGTTSAGTGGTSKLPTSGEVVFFGLTQQNPYVAQWHTGAEEQAAKYGWTLRYIEATQSQQQQDSQIQQVLTSATKPIAIILSPYDGNAAAASMLAIKKAGIPLVVIDSQPPASQDDLYTMYAGTNDTLNATTAAETLVAQAKKDNMVLGKGIIIGCPLGNLSCVARPAAFITELKKLVPTASIVGSYPSTGFGVQEGYVVASQVVPQWKGKINFIYGVNDGLAYSAVTALKNNGLVPGKNVLLIGGACNGTTTNSAVENGEMAGSGVQSPLIESELTVITIAQYLKNGDRVLPGSVSVGSSAPPSLNVPPHKLNFMPNPAVPNGPDGFQNTKIWGIPAATLCSYTS